jgi:hypothetical protein
MVERLTDTIRAMRSASNKTLGAAGQDRPDIAQARQNWKTNQSGLDVRRLVFTWCATLVLTSI